MFRSLQVFNYRVWFIGALFSNVGSWIQTTAITWYILTELTDGDATVVGLAIALQFAPNFLLLPLTGWISDRFDRRHTIAVTQTLLLLQVGALGMLVLYGAVNLPLILLFTAIYGIISAIDIPVRQTFVTDLVSTDNVSNAIALNAASYNLGRLLGPAVAGLVLITWGAGWAFLANSLSYLALLVAIVLMRPAEMVRRPTMGAAPKVWGGFRYIGGRPDLLFIIVMMTLVSTFATNLPLITATVVNMFQGDAADFGFVNTAVAVGSLGGALVAARNRSARIPVLILSFGLMAVSAFAGAFAPSVLWYSVPLVLSGFATILALATANGYVQSTSHPLVRGRVLAAYLAITLGAMTIGAPILGAVTDLWGARWTVLLSGIAALAAMLGGLIWLRRGHSVPFPEDPPAQPAGPTEESDGADMLDSDSEEAPDSPDDDELPGPARGDN